MCVDPTRNGHILELAGLPGSGKTTLSESLLESLGPGHVSLTGKYRRWLRRIRFDKLFSPLTAAKFHRVFNELYQNGAGHSQVSFPLWMLKLIWRGIIIPRRRLAINSPTSILLHLNKMLMDYYLASIEAFVYRKFVILDEGFVQHGLEAWLRAPSAIHQTIWSAYVSGIPKGTLCVVLTCAHADEALRRAQLRPHGLPVSHSLLQQTLGFSSEANWLSEQYEGMSQLLTSPILSSRVKCFQVDTELSREQLAEILLHKARELASGRDLVVLSWKQ
jgi:hypothetical protein